jgi:hypothetical protein
VVDAEFSAILEKVSAGKSTHDFSLRDALPDSAMACCEIRLVNMAFPGVIEDSPKTITIPLR